MSQFVQTAPQTAWITGASSGIGLAIVQALLDKGWRVLGIDKNKAPVTHENYMHVEVDLSDVSAVTTFLQSQTQTSSTQPFAFVHAAGLMHTASLGSLDTAAGAHMWQVHVQAATLLANALLPRMQAAKAGRMVLIGSRVSGGMAGRSQYAASKAALVSLCRSWAAEVIADSITVNVISPAATDTPMLKSGVRSSSAPKLPPIGRLIDPAEVAELVAYLCSPHASAITGQDIAICGGSSLPK